MTHAAASPVVHLELHTADLERACAFYAGVCGWRTERLEAGGRPYRAMGLGRGMDGGVVECGAGRPLWLPYVWVPDVEAATVRAREMGAAVPLEPREGPAGWRSVVATTAAGEVGFWQPRSRAPADFGSRVRS